ncbi:MAG: hypothetical protein ABSG78_23310 [Verrucomicrobiota bacterium]|jgi:hypothetical protein
MNSALNVTIPDSNLAFFTHKPLTCNLLHTKIEIVGNHYGNIVGFRGISWDFGLITGPFRTMAQPEHRVEEADGKGFQPDPDGDAEHDAGGFTALAET